MIARCVLALLLMAGRAEAHTRSFSYSDWTLREGGATVRVRIAALDVNALEGAGMGAAQLPQRLFAIAGSERCRVAPESFRSLVLDGGWQGFEWNLECNGAPRIVRSDLLFDVVPGHLHVARARCNGATSSVEQLLSEGKRELRLPTHARSSTRTTLVLQYAAIGVAHILTGWDHLVFLLMLILIARSIREVALAVTGFTVGHSLTLGLAVLGWATAHQRSVEVLIGVSIVLVAVENVWALDGRRSFKLPAATIAAMLALAAIGHARATVSAAALAGAALFGACQLGLVARGEARMTPRWALSALFGLVHGFGFAGALLESGSIPRQIGWSLLGFNLGVEAAQLAVVMVSWPLLAIACRRRRATVVQWGSATAVAAGAFWCLVRAF